MVYADLKEGLLKTVNVLAYLLFLMSHNYVTIFPQLIYENANVKETYFTPDVLAFFVWPFIHILLLCTIVYSFASDHGKTVMIDGISWEFPLFTVLFAIFVTVRASHNQNATFFTSFFLNYVGFSLYATLMKDHSLWSTRGQFFVLLPFSACQAWNAFLFCLTAFEAFGVDATENNSGIGTGFVVVFALFLLVYVAWTLATSVFVGDRPACFIISWTLWTISVHQRSSGFIHVATTISFILTLPLDIMALDSVYRTLTGRENLFSPHERISLLGS